MSFKRFQGFLFSNFAKHRVHAHDFQSTKDKSAALCLMLSNITLTINMIIFVVPMMIYENRYLHWILPIVLSLGLNGGSLFLLQRQKDMLGAYMTIFYMHCSITVIDHFGGVTTAMLPLISVFPGFCFLVGFEKRDLLISYFVCYLQFGYCTFRALNIFQTTLNADQTTQVFSTIIISFLVLTHSGMSFIFILSKEKKTWKIAKKNFIKSEKLTSVIMETVKSKGAFVSSISTELKDSIILLQTNFNHLLQLIRKYNLSQTVQSTKLNITMLYNMSVNLTNICDRANPQAGLGNVSTSLPKIIEETLTIHALNMRRKNIVVKAQLNARLSTELWADSTGISLIIHNLLSNALKYTQLGGNIAIYSTWSPQNTSHETLLKPIVPSSWNENSEPGNHQSTAISNILGGDFNNLREQEEDLTLEEFSEFDIKIRKRNMKSVRIFDHISLKQVDDFLSPSQTNPNWIVQYSELADVSIRPQDSLDNPQNPQRSSSLSQSIRYSPSSSRVKGYLKVQVTDNGMGISEPNLVKVFDIFGWRQDADEEDQTSSGLGLWLSKQLCQRMNGNIQVYSALNKGTTFVFYVPVDDSPVRLQTLIKVRPYGKVTSLVVDDYQFNQDLHRMLLEKEDVHVVVASDGKEALDIYSEYGGEYFDFIMMDVRMPIMDGFESTKQIRRWEQEHHRQSVEICFVSGEYFTEEEMTSKIAGEGAACNMTKINRMRKPIDIGALRTLVKKYRDKLNC